jgi:pilus assembly protein CpaB
MNRAASFSLGGSSRLGLLLAAALAAITGVLVFVALESSGGGDDVAPIAAGGETLVVTASQDIPARTEITAEMVRVARVPENILLPGAFTSQDLVIGRVARIPIFAGEQLVQEKLASSRTDLGLAYIVPEGLRGMAVEVDRVISPSGLVRPGDRVDIIAVVDVVYEDLDTERKVTVTRSFIVAQNIEVLAVEQSLQNRPVIADSASAAADDGTLVEQPEADPEGEVVTMALSPIETQNLLLVDEKGAIRLSVRAPGDTTVLDLDDSTFLALSDEDFQEIIIEILSQPKDE